MASYINTATSTTMDATTGGLLIRVVVEDGLFLVSDFVGLRYGAAPDIRDALAAWADDVQAIIAMPEGTVGGPLLNEVQAYKKALV